MAEYAVDGSELKKLMALAKTKSLPFAFNPGKTDEEHHLAMHRKRDAAILAKSARKEGAGNKVAYGTCKVEGSVLWLTCTESVPGMAKKLKKLLKNNKVSLAVKVVAADGSVLEDDGEPVPQDEEAGSVATTSEKSPASKDEMGERLTEIRQRLRGLAGDVAKRLLNDVDSALSTFAYQGEEGVRSALERIEETFIEAQADAEAAAAHEAEERAALTARTEALIAALGKVGSSGAKRLLVQAEYIASKLAGASLFGLREALDKVETAARELLPEGGAPAATPPPAAPAAPPPAAAEAPAAAPQTNPAAAARKKTKEEMSTDLSALRSRLADLVGTGAKKLLGEVDSVLGTVAYQSEAAVEAALARIQEAMAQAEAESEAEKERAARQLADLKARLDQVFEGIGKISGPAVQRLTQQADYLAERISKNVLDGVEHAMNGLEKALRDVLPAEPAQEQTAAEPAAPATAPSPNAGAAGPAEDIAALTRRLKEAAALIAQTPADVQTRLKAAFDAVVARAKARDLDSAREGLAKVEAALARLGAASSATATTAEDPRAAKVRGALRTLSARVAALPPGDTAAALQVQLAEVETLIAGGSFDQAVAGLKAVQESLQIQAEVDRLTPAFSRAMSDGSVSDTNRLGILFNTAVEGLVGPGRQKARAALQQVEAMLAAGGSDATREVPNDVKPFATSALRWRQTRGVLQAEMGKLEAAIKAACAGDDELQIVADSTSDLFGYIKSLDERLDAKLDQIVNSEPGAQRDGLRGEARALLADYQQELTHPFFADVDAGNGFVNVQVAATARAALGDIATVLSAA